MHQYTRPGHIGRKPLSVNEQPALYRPARLSEAEISAMADIMRKRLLRFHTLSEAVYVNQLAQEAGEAMDPDTIEMASDLHTVSSQLIHDITRLGMQTEAEQAG